MAEDTYTTKGRKVYEDEETGENFSERTITFETKYGWVTIPTVDESGAEIDQKDQWEMGKVEDGYRGKDEPESLYYHC